MELVLVIHMGLSDYTTPGSQMDNNSLQELDSKLIRNRTSGMSLISASRRTKVVNLGPAFGSEVFMMASVHKTFIFAGDSDL